MVGNYTHRCWHSYSFLCAMKRDKCRIDNILVLSFLIDRLRYTDNLWTFWSKYVLKVFYDDKTNLSRDRLLSSKKTIVDIYWILQNREQLSTLQSVFFCIPVLENVSRMQFCQKSSISYSSNDLKRLILSSSPSFVNICSVSLECLWLNFILRYVCRLLDSWRLPVCC